MASRGWLELSQAPILRARERYGRWGALAKVDLLEREFGSQQGGGHDG